MTDLAALRPFAVRIGATLGTREGVPLYAVPGWSTLYDVTLFVDGASSSGVADRPCRFFYRGSVRELFDWKRQRESEGYIRIEITKVNEHPEAEGWLRECWANGG